MNKQRREKIRQLKARFQDIQTELKQISSELVGDVKNSKEI